MTGSAGSGKTVFCRELASLGAALIDVDTIGRVLIDNDPEIQQTLKTAFGKQIFDSDGNLKRRMLGRMVFSDPDSLDRLNRIVLDPMLDAVRSRIDSERLVHPVVVVDMAILFEADVASWFDRVILIVAPEERSIEWLKESRGWSREETLDRIARQMPVESKIALADDVILNDGNLDDLREKARNYLKNV